MFILWLLLKLDVLIIRIRSLTLNFSGPIKKKKFPIPGIPTELASLRRLFPQSSLQHRDKLYNVPPIRLFHRHDRRQQHSSKDLVNSKQRRSHSLLTADNSWVVCHATLIALEAPFVVLYYDFCVVLGTYICIILLRSAFNSLFKRLFELTCHVAATAKLNEMQTMMSHC